MIKELRHYKRFKVVKCSTVLVRPTMTLSYAVLDIGPGGLAFSYFGWENWLRPDFILDILDIEFFCEDIPIHVKNDIQLVKGSKNLRRCGLEFSNLSSSQKIMLRQYISSVAA